ncbi:MAG: hypothetical protein ACK5NE_03205 [Brachymonas sp.]
MKKTLRRSGNFLQKEEQAWTRSRLFRRRVALTRSINEGARLNQVAEVRMMDARFMKNEHPASRYSGWMGVQE